MSNSWHSYIVVLVLSLLSVSAWGQIQNSNISPKINSPLSRFGLGDPAQQYFSAAAGMAGLSAGWQDPFQLNVLNPASLASLQSTAFEGGLYARRTTLQSNGNSDFNWSGNLQYLALGFTLRNVINKTLDRQSDDWNAGMSFALVPLSQVGYDIRLVDLNSPGVEISTNTLKGSGGTTRLRWGTGFRYKQLSVGIDAGFLFGKLINSRLVNFDSLEGSLDTEFQDDVSFRGTTWTLGAQYAFEFKELNKKGEKVPSGKRIVLGAYASNEKDISVEGTRFTRRYLSSIVSDTLLSEVAVAGTATLPASFTMGVHYQNLNKVNLGVEYGFTGWSSYRNNLKEDALTDSYFLAVGGEFTPNFNSYNNYWERVRYRAGFRIGTDPRTIDGQQIKGYSFSVGAGFPIVLPRQQVSFVNTSVELGRSGVNNVFEESFVRFNLGFTLNDNSWFFKRKFN
jgi:long-subunit fatty acid transport protein